jgi:hypothetical protein
LAGISWGLADFAIGFCIGTFVLFGLTYPAVMVPAFLAPLSVVFHGPSIWQISNTAPVHVINPLIDNSGGARPEGAVARATECSS